MSFYKSDVTCLKVEQQRDRRHAFPFDAIFKIEGFGTMHVAVPVERPDVFQEGAAYVLSIDPETRDV